MSSLRPQLESKCCGNRLLLAVRRFSHIRLHNGEFPLEENRFANDRAWSLRDGQMVSAPANRWAVAVDCVFPGRFVLAYRRPW